MYLNTHNAFCCFSSATDARSWNSNFGQFVALTASIHSESSDSEPDEAEFDETPRQASASHEHITSIRKMHCVYLNTSINQSRLTLSTLHAEMCCWKHTISTDGAIHVESWNHEELRHVGLTPRALCVLKSPEQVSQNYFAAVKCILPWMKMILPW